MGGLKQISRMERGVWLNFTPAAALPTIVTKKKYPETSDFECSAVLVDRFWAMTAAHCLDGNKERELREFVKLTFIDPVKNEVMVITSRFYIRHPDYLAAGDNRDSERHNRNSSPKKSIGYANDIAFIRLDKPIDNITPVKIDWGEITDQKIESIEPRAKVCGWGRMEARGNDHPSRLQCVSLNLVTGSRCNKLYNPYKELGLVSLSDSVLCAADKKYKKDACYGDSGGPLFQDKIDPGTRESRPYIIGIVSDGDRCAKRGKPGIYTRLSHFEHFGRCIIDQDLACDYVKNSLTDNQWKKLSVYSQ